MQFHFLSLLCVLTDVVLQTAEKKLQMLTWPASRSPIKPHTHSPVIKVRSSQSLPLTVTQNHLAIIWHVAMQWHSVYVMVTMVTQLRCIPIWWLWSYKQPFYHTVYLSCFQLSICQAEVELPLESDGAAFPPRVIAMVAGYLQKAKPGLPRYQNIVVLASDWTVYCLSPTLKVKWSKKVASTLADDMMIRCVLCWCG